MPSKMKPFFSPNIATGGRILRAILGLLLLLAAWRAGTESPWWCGFLALMGLFTLYEAKRGWCIARACGLRTLV